MTLEYVSEILVPRLFAASVQSILLVAVVWTLCRLLPRLPATARCWLWWLVALQLVVGVLWANPLTLPLLPAEPETQAMLAPLQSLAAPAATNAAILPSEPQVSSPLARIASQSSAWSWSLTFALLWLLVLSIMVTRTLLGYQATRRLLQESVPCRDATLLQALTRAAGAHGLRRAPKLRLSSAISSPQLIGPWSPVLMLPAHRLSSLDADELDMALAHELTHLQRGDLWWGLLPAMAQHLFFFHPLAHLAAREYAFAREAACDAAVLAGNPHCAGDYGRLLVRLGVAARPNAGLASASPTFLMLKRRLLMLQQNTSSLRASALALTIAVALFGVVPYRVTAQAVQTTASVPSSAPAALAVPAPVATPITMISLQTIAAPRIVPAPPAAHAPPTASPALSTVATVVPAAPTALLAPRPDTVNKGKSSGYISSSRSNGYAHVLIDGNTINAVGDTEDLRAAESQQRNGEAMLWARKDGNKYVVRDAATLRRLQAAYAPVAAVGAEQGRLSAQQGELGAQQGGLGARQGQIGAQQGELTAQLVAAIMHSVKTGSDASKAEIAAVEQRLAALGRQQDQLGREQQAFGNKQQELSRQQQGLGERQRVASEAAQREADRLIGSAIAHGLAERVQ